MIDALIELGKKQGYLTSDQIASALERYKSPDIKKVYNRLKEAGITIQEEPEIEEDLSKIKITPADDWAGGSMDSVAMYLREIGQYRIPTKEEELALAETMVAGREAAKTLKAAGKHIDPEKKAELDTLVKKGKKARTELVERNLRLVVSVARRYQNNGLPLLDLIQSGNLGLMRCMDSYETSVGCRLSTYATWWIRQAITRDLANSSRDIRLPVHVSEEVRKLNMAIREYEKNNPGTPTAAQLADLTGFSEEKVVGLQTITTAQSLNAPIVDGEPDEIGDFIADDEQSLTELMENVALRDALYEAMDTVLRPREKNVLIHRFGLDNGGVTMTLQEVGDLMHVTRERVRQIEGTALRKLKATSRRRGYEDFLMD